ncbi:MAG: TRAP transporter small permease [Saprospiraceae bacterium]
MRYIYLKLNKFIELFLVIIFGLLVLDVLMQVGSRYILGKSFSFTEEFARFSLIWLSILGAAYLNGQREHLSMDFLYRKFSKEKQVTATKITEVLIAIFSLVVMVIGGFNLVYITLHLGQLSPALHLPLGYVYMIVPISGLIIIFYAIYNISIANHSIKANIK